MLKMIDLPIKHQTKGFGIVEIFVSLIISIVLSAGIFNLFQSNKRAYRLEQNLAELQQNGRFATTFLNRTIRLAGFRSQPKLDQMESYKDYQDIFPSGSELIAGTNDDVNGSDTLTIRYQGSSNGNIFDCLATPVQADKTAVSTFFINNQNQLVCAAVNNGVPNLNNPDVLVNNVEAMQIRFGEDLTNDGVVNRYVPPDYPDLDLKRVISVRVSLLLRTGDESSPVLDNKYYALQDTEVGPFNDHYLRKVFTTTVLLRSKRS